MRGEWVKPKGSDRYHFLHDEVEEFLCGLPYRNSRRNMVNRFASYDRKCDTCLVRMVEEANQEETEIVERQQQARDAFSGDGESIC